MSSTRGAPSHLEAFDEDSARMDPSAEALSHSEPFDENQVLGTLALPSPCEPRFISTALSVQSSLKRDTVVVAHSWQSQPEAAPR